MRMFLKIPPLLVAGKMNDPLTRKSSSTTTVPAAESRVRLPEAVSISVTLLTPT